MGPERVAPNTLTFVRVEEPPRARRAFQDYVALGPERSDQLLYDSYLRAAQETDTKPFASLWAIRRWHTEYNWDERLAEHSLDADYNAELNRLDIMRLEHQAAARRIEAWDEVQTEHRNRMVDIGQRLLAKVEQMLDAPIFKDEVQEDGQTIVRLPIKWQASDIARYIEVADKVVRLAAEMDTSRDKTTVVADERIEEMARKYGLQRNEIVRKLEEITSNK